MNDADIASGTLSLGDYPFDQYQRYGDVGRALAALRVGAERPLRVLDVGGSPVARRFLGGETLTSVNIEAEAEIDIQADGARLPFPDAHFDAVVTVDTLEHVPPPLRQAFLLDLWRVTGDWLIVTGPFANGYNEAAEAILNDYFIDALGLQHRFLSEHLAHGLPDVDEVERWLAPLAAATLGEPSGYLHDWLPLMAIQNTLRQSAAGRPLAQSLDQRVNASHAGADQRRPAYRRLFVAARRPVGDRFAALRRAMAPPNATAPDLNGVVALWQTAELLPQLQAQAAELEQLRVEKARLEALVAGYEAGRVMQAMATARRWLGR